MNLSLQLLACFLGGACQKNGQSKKCAQGQILFLQDGREKCIKSPHFFTGPFCTFCWIHLGFFGFKTYAEKRKNKVRKSRNLELIIQNAFISVSGKGV